MLLWAIIAIILAVIVFAIIVFNQLVRSRQMANEAWSGIDVQLKRRSDLVPNLVDAVKGYAAHERSVLEEVTAIRGAARALPSDDVARRAQAEGALSAALGRLFALAENYPDLKASANFLELQQQLSDLENEIQMARRYYNGAVRNLNVRFLDLNDYVNRYIHHSVQRACELRGIDRINLIGVCQGGSLSLCYTALHPERIANLITMVTPVDFKTPNDLLSKWSQYIDIDLLVNTAGNVAGEQLNAMFLALRPFRLVSQKYMALLDIVDKEAATSDETQARIDHFVRMEQWIFDSPDNPGEMFRQFLIWFYKENRLKLGKLQIGGKPVSLRNITVPVLNIYASEDHIVPPAASMCLQELIGSTDYTAYAFPGGHIGIYVSSRCQELPVTMAQWLKARPSA